MATKKNKKKEIGSESVLTEKIDTGAEEFDQFQAFLLNKSKDRSEKQQQKIDMLSLQYKMQDYIKTAGHSKTVGDFIREYLNVLGIKHSEFARYLDINPSNFSKILSGERPLNYELALILGVLFEVEPIIWLTIQNRNKLHELEKEKKNELKEYSIDDIK